MTSSTVSVRDAQQSLLWSMAAVACFTGSIEDQQVRLRWNSALRNLYGLSASQSLRGGPLMNNRIAAADRQRIEHACAELIGGNAPINLTFRVSHSGDTREVRLAAQRIDDTNRIVGLLQQCDAAAQPATTISQNRWQSVGRLTLLDEVTSAMAHELNQPLAAISMFAQVGERVLALPEPRLDKARQVFHDVSQQALRAGDLIHNMRNLVKRHVPTKVRLSVAELIRGFASVAEPMARTHHVDFRVPAGLPAEFVVVDVTQINQVLSILFQNALDAVNDNDTKTKSIEVTARLDNGKVIITITDSGKGVASSATAQLFQPFFSTKENGTGLGLISARNILETYGSHLAFSNLPQGGCGFSFALPTVPVA